MGNKRERLKREREYARSVVPDLDFNACACDCHYGPRDFVIFESFPCCSGLGIFKGTYTDRDTLIERKPDSIIDTLFE